MIWRDSIKIVWLLVMVGLCLFEFMLHRQISIFRGYEAAFLSLQWMLLACLAVWCGTFLFLTFSLKDWLLIGLLLIAITFYFIGYAVGPSRDALTLLAGVTLGKGAKFFLCRSSRRKEAPTSKAETGNRGSEMSQSLLTSAATYLIGLTGLLAFAAWWHLDMSANFYHGPRWMGLWDNPNIYGMLMSAGLVLAIGLLAAKRKAESGN